LDWSGPANILLIEHVDGLNHAALWTLAPDGRQPPRPLVDSPSTNYWARLSPDGRWLAYASSESGRFEVYLVPYPGLGSKVQVSIAGGSFPQWRADGKELFFQSPDQSIMAVEVRAGATLAVGSPQLLFKTTLTEGVWGGYRWAPTRDGRRFLVNTPQGRAAGDRLVVVTNWAQGLPRR